MNLAVASEVACTCPIAVPSISQHFPHAGACKGFTFSKSSAAVLAFNRSLDFSRAYSVHLHGICDNATRPQLNGGPGV
jgi:hypothetical protein